MKKANNENAGEMMKKKTVFTGIVRKIGIVLLIALLVEGVVFNCRFWQSLFYEEITLEEVSYQFGGVTDYGEGFYVLEEGREAFCILLEGFDAKVHNLHLDLQLSSSIELPFAKTGVMDVKIMAKDELYRDFYEVNNDVMHTEAEESKYIWPSTYGNVTGLYLEITPKNTGTFLLNDIVINARQPFVFHEIRFACIFVVVSLFALLQKDSFFWTEDCNTPTRKKKITVMAMFFLYGAMLWFFVSGNSAQISLYGSDFNPYQDLAEAFAAGQLHLLESPTEELMAMDNPYDYLARENDGVLYKWDTVYYDGNYYVYFGVIPCLLFYYPLFAMTGLHMPDVLVLFFMALLFAPGCYFLIKSVLNRFFVKVSFGLLCVFSMTMTLGCQIPFFIIQPDPYNVPILAGMNCLVWGIGLWISALEKGKNDIHYPKLFAGSFCMAMTLGCRPQMVLFSLLAFPLFWECKKTEEGYGKKDITKGVTLVMLPFVVVGIAVGIYNWLRFDSFFEFGAKYNLTVMNMTVSELSLEKVIHAAYEYLLRLPNLQEAFPFVELLPAETLYWQKGCMFIELMYGGIVACNPVLLLALVNTVYRKEWKEKRILSFSWFLLVVSGVIMIVDVVLAGISYRYLGDFSFALFLASFLGITELWNQSKGLDKGESLRRGLLAALLLSVLFNCMLFFSTSDKYPLNAGNTALYYEIINSINVL